MEDHRHALAQRRPVHNAVIASAAKQSSKTPQRHSREGVAKAGIHSDVGTSAFAWVPAFAGTTVRCYVREHANARG